MLGLFKGDCPKRLRSRFVRIGFHFLYGFRLCFLIYFLSNLLIKLIYALAMFSSENLIKTLL